MQTAERIITAGRIVTMSGPGDAEALAIANGRIASVGRTADVDRLSGPGTIRDHFPDATVTPGLIDAHLHTVKFGLGLGQVDLDPRIAPDMKALVRQVGRRAQLTTSGEWILGRGYDQNQLAAGRHPTRWDLDEVSPGHPVMLTHNSGHMSVANSLALQLAGIGPDTPAPAGGAISRDASGLPDGLLQETAQSLVRSVVPPPDRAQVREAIRLAHLRFAQEGLTAVHEAGCPSAHPAEIGIYQESLEQGELLARTHLMIYPRELPEGCTLGLGLRTQRGTAGLLTIGPLKLMADGSLIGLTAVMHDPFEGLARDTGIWVTAPEQLRQLAATGHRAGWQLATHAIGDKAVETVLDIYEALQRRWPRAEARHRIEHCGVLNERLVARLAATGTIPVTQPRFICQLGEGFRRALGEQRLRLTYPLRTLLEAGIRVAAGSDRPVVDGAPLLGIHAGVNQMTAAGRAYVPAEAVTFRQALAMYTVNAARAAHQEAFTGSLAPGMAADLTILGGDPERDPSEIGSLPVLATMVGGRWTHLA